MEDSANNSSIENENKKLSHIPEFSLKKTYIAVVESMKIEGYKGTTDPKIKKEAKKILLGL